MSDKTRLFYEFEEFRLDAVNPSLWREDKLVSISPKALETLILLVAGKGEIVSREELLEKVWKETYVEEGNINYTISLLRKTLGSKDFIQTVPRRGYRFVAEIRQIGSSEAPPPQPETVIEQRANKNRPILFAATFLSILLMTLLGLSWRGSATKADPPAETESMLAYRRGKLILDDRDVEDRAQKALDEFQQAVTLDPTSALAYTGLAEGFASKAASAMNEQNREYYAKAKFAAEKAFSLDENLFEAFLIRGWVRRNGDWDWSGAEQDFRRAIEIDPDSALAHFRYAELLSNTGRQTEALAEIKKAAELDPLSEMIISGHFPVLESAGEYDRALKLAEEYLRTNSESPFARRALGTFQYHAGDYAKVIETGEIALAKSGKRRPFAWLSLLAASYSKTNQTEKADAMLSELEAQSQTDKKALYSLAMNYAELGRTEEAVTALEKCYEAREQRMLWVSVEPRFANLKTHARFQEILANMRLI